MEIKLDLHIHSEHSPDGRMPLREIVSRAKALGLQGVAVCDHDRVWMEPFREEGFLLIPGAEFSTEYGHLLGLFLTGPIEKGNFAETVAAIHAQGGLAVLAHPFARSADPARLEPIAACLDGIEVWNGRADRKIRNANALAAEFAAQRGLPAFAGSDAHVPQEIGNGVLTLEADALTLDAVKAALRSGGRTSGKAGKHRYVAMSQLTKRRKTGAGPLSYLKWALFALKCCGEDLIGK